MKKKPAKSKSTTKKAIKDLSPAQKKMVKGGATSTSPKGMIFWH